MKDSNMDTAALIMTKLQQIIHGRAQCEKCHTFYFFKKKKKVYLTS
jgi:hypothetical protein